MNLLTNERRRQLRRVPLLRPTYRWLRMYWHYFCFVFFSRTPLSIVQRIALLRKFHRVTKNVECAHTEGEILEVVSGILSLPPDLPGLVVEAGCFKGGSTAKFSIVCHQLGRSLLALDSFEGIPDNDDPHDVPSVFGHTSYFGGGAYAGSYQEVTEAVSKYGQPDICSFLKGWFEDTMPGTKGPFAAVYIDVDLPSSTRTCLKYLYPSLSPGGLLFSQDAHLPPVVDVFEDADFWRQELGVEKPAIVYSRYKTILWIRKPGRLLI